MDRKPLPTLLAAAHEAYRENRPTIWTRAALEEFSVGCSYVRLDRFAAAVRSRAIEHATNWLNQQRTPAAREAFCRCFDQRIDDEGIPDPLHGKTIGTHDAVFRLFWRLSQMRDPHELMRQ